MCTAAALTWVVLGAMIAAVVFFVVGGMQKLFKGTVIIAVTAVGLTGWLMAYWSMAAFNPWLTSTSSTTRVRSSKRTRPRGPPLASTHITFYRRVGITEEAAK